MRATPRIIRKLGFSIICLLLIACSGNIKATRELVGKLVPSTKFTLLDGSYLTTQELRGKTAVITFWATWCNNSRRAIMKVNSLAKGLKGRTDMVFVAVSLDKNEKFQTLKDRIYYDNLDAFVHAFSGNEGDDEAYLSCRGENLPYFVVIDRTGKIVDNGYDVDLVFKALGVDPDSVRS